MWSKISDDFYDHPKTMCCSLAAVGLWTCCMSYAARHKTNGKIPRAYALRTGSQELADELVNAGLWDEMGDEWSFHDWKDYQPTSYEQRKYKTDKDPEKVRAGSAGGQKTASKSTADEQQMSSPEPEPDTSSKEEVRDDIRTIHEAFNESLKARGIKPKRASKTSIRAVRLMLDTDGHTVDQILRCIEWVTASDFWSTTVLSLPTLRKKYDTLRLQAQRDVKSAPQQSSNWDNIPWAGELDDDA